MAIRTCFSGIYHRPGLQIANAKPWSGGSQVVCFTLAVDCHFTCIALTVGRAWIIGPCLDYRFIGPCLDVSAGTSRLYLCTRYPTLELSRDPGCVSGAQDNGGRAGPLTITAGRARVDRLERRVAVESRLPAPQVTVPPRVTPALLPLRADRPQNAASLKRDEGRPSAASRRR